MILGRIMQNIKLARKYKMKIKLASFARNPYELRDCNDLLSFGILVGLHPSEAKKALTLELS
jgi:RNase P/RNase MRP subunit p30